MGVPATADVVVAGAGIVGCATAYALAKRGLEVALLERSNIGGAASGASLACIGTHMIDAEEIPLLQAACRLWQGYREELESDIEYQRCGQIRFIARESDFVAARRWLDAERAGGLEVSLLDPPAVRELVPALSGAILGATWSPDSATLNPSLTCRALVEAASIRGMTLLTGTAVIGLEQANGRVEGVITTGGTIATRSLVNACGAWAGRLGERAGFAGPIRPRKAQCLTTARLPPAIPCVVGSCDSGGIKAGYLQMKQARDGRVLLSATAVNGALDDALEDQELSVDQAVLRNALRTFLSLFPGLKDAPLLRSWARHEAVTLDGRFLAGPVAALEGYFLAAGGNGASFTRAPLIAEALAGLIAEGTASYDLGPYDPHRFEEAHAESTRAESHA